MATTLQAIPTQTQDHSRPFPNRRECIALAGDVVVGDLLTQIVFWYKPGKNGKSKLRVKKRDGQYCIAKTREEWMAETGLTLKQYNRAIKVLKEKGLVEVEQHLYAGRNMSHLRLKVHPSVLIGRAQACPQATPECVHREQSYTQTTTEKTYISSCVVPDASAETDTEKSKETGRSSTEEDRDTSTEIPKEESSEIVTEDGIVTPNPLPPAQPEKNAGLSVPGLITFWRKTLAVTQGGFQKPLTRREVGQLKYLHKLLGGDRAQGVIDYALNNWWKFANRAAVEAGTPFPASPQVGFLLKHVAVAVNLMDEKTKPKEKSAATSTPVESSVESKMVSFAERIAVQKAQAHKMSDEEFAQMMTDLDAEKMNAT